MGLNFCGKALPHRRREIRDERAAKVRVMGDCRSAQFCVEIDLGISKEDREFRARERLPRSRPFLDRGVRWQVFERSIKPPGVFEPLDQPLLESKIGKALLMGKTNGKRLKVVILED